VLGNSAYCRRGIIRTEILPPSVPQLDFAHIDAIQLNKDEALESSAPAEIFANRTGGR
jgi:hypothetical protein